MTVRSLLAVCGGWAGDGSFPHQLPSERAFARKSGKTPPAPNVGSQWAVGKNEQNESVTHCNATEDPVLSVNLFMLVSALMGTDRMQAAYAYAVEQQYRFYSYGDASLLLPRSLPWPEPTNR